MEHRVFSPFPLPEAPVFPARVVSVLEYGAVPDGQTLCTDAFAAAVDDMKQAGGGRINVPAGEYLTGPIHLASNIELHLEKGSLLRFSDCLEDYLPCVFTMVSALRCYNYSPLIYARNAENVALTGEGTLDGRGQKWWPWKPKEFKFPRSKPVWQTPVEERVYGTPDYAVRPHFVQFIECKNVLVEGVTLINSPSWVVHPLFCENVIVRGLTINNPAGAFNSDGVDVDSCRRVLVEDCRIDTYDDLVCLKSGRNEEGRAINRPCENVVIRRITSERGYCGITVGSETTGGIRNILAYDCDFANIFTGARIKTCPGRGGYIEQVEYRDLRLRHLSRAAISFSMRYAEPENGFPEAAFEYMPQVSNICAANITCDGAETGIEVECLRGHGMKHLILENLKIKADRGMQIDQAPGMELHHIELL